MMTVRSAGLAMKTKKKKDSGKLAIHPDHPRRRIEVKVRVTGVLECVVIYVKFY